MISFSGADSSADEVNLRGRELSRYPLQLCFPSGAGRALQRQSVSVRVKSESKWVHVEEAVFFEWLSNWHYDNGGIQNKNVNKNKNKNKNKYKHVVIYKLNLKAAISSNYKLLLFSIKMK